MTLRIDDVAPDFSAETTQGTIRFHDWIGDGWALLFSHPKDFTPVCTTELGVVAALESEFAARGCKVIGISVDEVSDHEQWLVDIESATGQVVNYPLIGDPQARIVTAYGMLPADRGGSVGERAGGDGEGAGGDGGTTAGSPTSGDPAIGSPTARTVFIIGPDRRVRATLTYPMNTGRNFAEILRLLDSIQLAGREQVATPANWNQGDDVMIASTVSDEQAAARYPEGWNAPLPYLRVVKQPA